HVAQRASESAEGLAERLPGGALSLVGPEEADGVFAGAAARGRARQIEEEPDVPAPQQVIRRGNTVDRDLNGAERLTVDHVRSGQPSCWMREAALSARARYGGSPPDQRRTTARYG